MGLLYLYLYSVPRSAIGLSPDSVILAIPFLSILRICCFPVIRFILSQIKGKFVPVNTMKSCRWTRVINPHILNLGARCGQIYSLDALLPGTELSVTSLSVTTFWKSEKFLPPARNRTPVHPDCFVVTIPTWLHRLPTYVEWSLTFICSLRFAGYSDQYSD
jgi:hypothetical protein